MSMRSRFDSHRCLVVTYVSFIVILKMLLTTEVWLYSSVHNKDGSKFFIFQAYNIAMRVFVTMKVTHQDIVIIIISVVVVINNNIYK